MSKSALKRRANEARLWLTDAFFPLWAERGLNQDGLFCEALDLDHATAERDFVRVRVQARQTYVFAEALRLGWRPDIATDRIYDIAFTLFAIGEADAALGGMGETRASASALLDSVDRQMRDRTNGGYAEALPPPQLRLQNPHMHLLEACLSLHNVDPDGGHLDRASEIVSLFLARLTAGPGKLLGERFTTDWGIPEGRDGDIVEPGHQFEWVWLLHQYAEAAGVAVPEAAGTLYAFACTTLDDAGRACQEVTRAGAPVDGSRRTWPQTEALKAHLAMYEYSGDERFAAAACTSFDVLLDEFLTVDGGWIDHYGAGGDVLARDMPASTGYHVVLAFAELIRVMKT